MKTLFLSISSLLMLAVQGNAQQQPLEDISSSTTTSVTSHVKTIINVSSSQQESEPQRVKTFTKSFPVDKNDKINLSNQYGSIIIKTWDKNEIKVDAIIKAYASTDAQAQKMLELASINAQKTNGSISFDAEIGSRNNWSNNGKKREVKAFLTVYMPSTNALRVIQEYGDVVMGDYHGPTSLTVEYGTLTTGDLKSTNNVISIEYGKAIIKSVNQAKINHEFGSGTTIGSAGILNINAGYTNIKIGSVKGKSILSLEYGKLTVDDINANLTINADYSGVNLGFNTNFKSTFTVATSFGSFKYGANVSARRQNLKDEDFSSSERRYTGTIGKGDQKSEGSITVNSEYSDIIFK